LPAIFEEFNILDNLSLSSILNYNKLSPLLRGFGDILAWLRMLSKIYQGSGGVTVLIF